jgi:hypothetical protein
MSAIYPLSVHQRIERQWAERIKSRRQIRDLVVTATERTLQRIYNGDPLIPVPAGGTVDPTQLDRAQSRD